MPVPHRSRSLAGLAATLLLATPVAAQIVVVDEGIFTISVAGERVGREDFSIRHNRTDGGFVAQGNVLRADGRSTVLLTTDSTGLPFRFQFERFVSGKRVDHTSGEYRRGLWSARAVGPEGESGREFRLPEVIIAADDGVAHHAWFLLRFVRGGAVPVLRPRGLVIRPVVVESAGADSVLFGLEAYDAVRWIVRDGVDGPVLRELWADAQGRLLRVRVPRADLDATRDEPPPEVPAETRPPTSAYEAPDLPQTGFLLDAFAVACDTAPRIGDAVVGPGGPADADARRGARYREEEQPDLPAIGDRPHTRRGIAAVGVRPAAP